MGRIKGRGLPQKSSNDKSKDDGAASSSDDEVLSAKASRHAGSRKNGRPKPSDRDKSKPVRGVSFSETTKVDSGSDSESSPVKPKSKGKRDDESKKNDDSLNGSKTSQRSRGRPKKARLATQSDDSDDEALVKTPSRSQGRSKKVQDDSDAKDEDSPKRGRGRARKTEAEGEGKGELNTSKKSIAENQEEDEEDEEEDEEEYEVDHIVDHKIEKGAKYYLIRWKGYKEDTDSWELESDLNAETCIRVYREAHPEDKPVEKKRGRKPSKKKKPESKRPRLINKYEENESDENKDWEVERIVDVHFKRDGTREFLVRWKGYSSNCDTWEPEKNLDCTDMIERFSAKLNKVSTVTPKELRTARTHTQRFTLMQTSAWRRLSKRNDGRQRAVYYDAE